jgi:hypothetical protein
MAATRTEEQTLNIGQFQAARPTIRVDQDTMIASGISADELKSTCSATSQLLERGIRC